MSVAAAIREMLAKGLTLEDALAVAEAFEIERDDRSTAARRQARYRDRKREATVTKRNESDALDQKTDRNESDALLRKSVTSVTPLARVEDNPSTTETSGKKGSKNLGAKASRTVTPTARQILLECLSAESADAVLAHRRAMRRPLTARAAQLLAKGFLATADPNAAADMMIERGWQGFKPEWFDNARRSNGQQRSGKGSIVEAGRRLTARLVAEREERELRARNSGGEGDDAVRLLPSQRGERS